MRWRNENLFVVERTKMENKKEILFIFRSVLFPKRVKRTGSETQEGRILLKRWKDETD